MSKPIHMAKHIRGNGDVSPLCAETPKAIDLSKESWTNRIEAVTCSECKSQLDTITTYTRGEEDVCRHGIGFDEPCKECLPQDRIRAIG